MKSSNLKASSIIVVLTGAMALGACGGGGTSSAECFNVTTGQQAKYVANKVTLPVKSTNYAFDLVGDNSLKNALGGLLATLSGAGLKPQNGLDDGLLSGELALLFDQKADDLTNSVCSQVDLAIGKKPATPPKYDGTDVYEIDTAIGGGKFRGRITSNQYNSAQPATTKEPTTIQLKIPLLEGFAPLDFKVYGAHIQFRRSGDTLTGGEIHGALKTQDLNEVTIPAVVQLLNDRITQEIKDMGMPGMTSQSVLNSFDKGGANQGCNGACKNPDNSCGVANDKVIQVCEITTAGIVGSALRPDMKLFDASGNYKPQPGASASTYDAFSLGLGFEAVKATF